MPFLPPRSRMLPSVPPARPLVVTEVRNNFGADGLAVIRNDTRLSRGEAESGNSDGRQAISPAATRRSG
jgi:hypothetical protein